MRRRVRILRPAQADLVEIHAYIARDAPAAALRITSELLDAIDWLGLHAPAGTIPRDERLRALGFRFLVRGQYLVFYKASKAMVRIYRVLHARRAYDRIL